MRSKSSFHRLHQANALGPVATAILGGAGSAAAGAAIGALIGGSGERKIGNISDEAVEDATNAINDANDAAMELIGGAQAAIAEGMAMIQRYSALAQQANDAYTRQAAQAMTQQIKNAVMARAAALKDILGMLGEGMEASTSAIVQWSNAANEAIAPLVSQGDFAQDEMAAMLAIPGRDGKIRDFNLDKLRQTPGYEFMLQEGVRAVERTAVGKKLSSQTADRVKSRAEENAALAFNTRYAQLGQLAGAGAQGRLAQAQIMANAGSGIANTIQGYTGMGADAVAKLNPSDLFAGLGAGLGQLYSNAGRTASDIALQTGGQLGGMYSNLANVNIAGAGIEASTGEALANIILAGAGANIAGVNATTNAILGGAGIGAYIGTQAGLGGNNKASTVDNSMSRLLRPGQGGNTGDLISSF